MKSYRPHWRASPAGGIDALTAKSLGAALSSSARPIFTVFNNMKEVQDAVRAAAMHRFESYAEQKLPDMPLFKQVGMQMVLFGAKEPKLYQLLFMQENRDAVSFDDVFGELGPTAETCIGLIREEYGISRKGPDADPQRHLFPDFPLFPEVPRECKTEYKIKPDAKTQSKT